VPGTGVWTVGGLANGGSASLQIVATVATSGAIVNQATKTAQGETDPNSSNNAALVGLNAAALADIQVQQTVDNATPILGANVTFTLTVKNAGPSNASGVVIADLLPAGLTYVSDTGAGAYVPGTGAWTIGSINALASVNLQIVATTNSVAAITNTASKAARNERVLQTVAVLDKILWTHDATAAHCPEEAAFGCVSRLGARVGI
jgi:large repetitive protein